MVTYEGWRGVVEVEEKEGKKVATKSAKDNTKKWALNKEIQILSYLAQQGIDFVPQILDSWDGWFSYERIEGEHFKKEIRNATKGSPDQVEKYWKLRGERLVLWLLERAYQLDCVGVVHGEFIRPFTNILVWNQMGKIYIIDFERGKLWDFSGKNMRSLSQWLLAEWWITLSDCKSLGKRERKEMYQYISSKLKATSWKSQIQKWIFLIFYSLFLVFFDQLSKYLFYNLQRWIGYRFFTPVLNTGIGRSLPMPWWIILFISGGVLWGVVGMWRRKKLSFRPSILLIVGALGNGMDRLVYHGVRDFIDLHYWPIFNMADIYLSIAFVIIIYYFFIRKSTWTV